MFKYFHSISVTQILILETSWFVGTHFLLSWFLLEYGKALPFGQMVFCRISSIPVLRPVWQAVSLRRYALNSRPTWFMQTTPKTSWNLRSVTSSSLETARGAANVDEINWDALSKDDVELFQSLQAVVESLGDEATSDHPMVEVRDKLATAFRDKAALLKRNWTDEMFQEGEDMNEEKVAEIEAIMASNLGRSGGGLHNGQNLGNALDLVGVYMKNYKLDKADAVLSRCGPFVAQRGGVWMIKWLNHVPNQAGNLRVEVNCY